jgi:heavy metal translocating P-type ATPase
MKVRIVSSFPGRMRLQFERGPGHKAQMRDCIGRLSAIDGVLECRPVLDAASVIVRYGACVEAKLTGRRVAALIIYEAGAIVSRNVSRIVARDGEVERVKDISTDEPRGLNPLLVPTVALVMSISGLPAIVAGPVFGLSAIPVAGRALTSLRQRRATVDQLDFSALIVLATLGQYFTGSLMTWLIGLGDYIRARTMRKSRRAISELLSPAGQRAWRETNGEVVSVAVESLQAGDTVIVYPGDHIPVDGVVSAGKAVVDQKILTGESVPIMREPGDAVYALTSVVDGQMSIRVEHIGRETRAGQVVALIEDAPLSDTRVQNYAAMLGDRLVLPIFGLAGATYLFSGDPVRLAAVLILDFATGIRVSAPTAILSAMVGASRQGLFIKGGKAMEKLATVDAIVFDKTGTLTMGSPHVADVYSFDSSVTEDEVLRLAASAEANLKHPAAKAIVDAAQSRGLSVEPPEQMEYLLGLGVSTHIAGRRVQVGSQRHMRQSQIDLRVAEDVIARCTTAGQSIVCVAVDGNLIGVLTYTDPPRPESAAVVQALVDRGVKRIVMLTGDTAAAAGGIAGKVRITDVIADAFPEQKADVVQQLRDDGYIVAVIGDGVNDSPAFTRADVGISVAHGADVAKETADVILLDSNLWGLPRAIDISRGAMAILKQNINIIVGPTAIGLAGSVMGLSTPLISTVINNGTTVLAGLNAMRPLSHRPRGTRSDQPLSGGA